MIRTAAMAILLATSFVTHASSEAKAKADPAKGKIIAETVCIACHGADPDCVSICCAYELLDEQYGGIAYLTTEPLA